VQVLTQNPGAKVDATRADGVTALILAARNNQRSCVEQLLEGKADTKGAVPEGITGGTEEAGCTALHTASRMGYTEVVRVLVNHEAALNAQMKDGATPLILAAHNQQLQVVAALLNLGADKELRDEAGYTALLRAAARGAGDVTQALVAAKGDVHATLGDRTSALHLASRSGHAEVVAALLPHLESPDGGPADAADRDGSVAELSLAPTSTPLHLAAEKGHSSVVMLLVRAGASTDARDAQGRTARDLALEHERENVLEMLEDYER
jgi:ankyrin repeat protein